MLPTAFSSSGYLFLSKCNDSPTVVPSWDIIHFVSLTRSDILEYELFGALDNAGEQFSH